MSRYRFHIDSFSGALGDLPKKAHGDDAAVLAVLSEHPRFSCFDVSTVPLGKTLDRLKDAGRLEYDHSEPYPWVRVTVLPDPMRETCEACGGTGTGKHLGGRNFFACQPCHGDGWIEPAGTRGMEVGR